MNNLKPLAFILVAFLLMSKAYSQRPGIIQFGASFPVLEFADHNTHENAIGGAASGYNIGLHYIMYKFPKSGFAVTWGIDIDYNELQKDYRDDIELRIGLSTHKTNITKYSQYVNLPITAGLKYTLTNEHIGVFANAGLTVNTLKITDMVAEDNNQTLIQQMALGHAFGYKMGGGLLFNKNITVSVDYLTLGNHTILNHVKEIHHYGAIRNEDFKLKVKMLSVTLGYKFN
jgi:hypothetical protein